MSKNKEKAQVTKSQKDSSFFTSAALDEYKERLKRTRIDYEQEKSQGCKKEKLEEQHQLDIEEETDEKFLKTHARNTGASRMENYQERTGTSARV
jgi:hypothetical protein